MVIVVAPLARPFTSINQLGIRRESRSGHDRDDDFRLNALEIHASLNIFERQWRRVWCASLAGHRGTQVSHSRSGAAFRALSPPSQEAASPHAPSRLPTRRSCPWPATSCPPLTTTCPQPRAPCLSRLSELPFRGSKLPFCSAHSASSGKQAALLWRRVALSRIEAAPTAKASCPLTKTSCPGTAPRCVPGPALLRGSAPPPQ